MHLIELKRSEMNAAVKKKKKKKREKKVSDRKKKEGKSEHVIHNN